MNYLSQIISSSINPADYELCCKREFFKTNVDYYYNEEKYNVYSNSNYLGYRMGKEMDDRFIEILKNATSNNKDKFIDLCKKLSKDCKDSWSHYSRYDNSSPSISYLRVALRIQEIYKKVEAGFAFSSTLEPYRVSNNKYVNENLFFETEASFSKEFVDICLSEKFKFGDSKTLEWLYKIKAYTPEEFCKKVFSIYREKNFSSLISIIKAFKDWENPWMTVLLEDSESLSWLKVHNLFPQLKREFPSFYTRILEKERTIEKMENAIEDQKKEALRIKEEKLRLEREITEHNIAEEKNRFDSELLAIARQLWEQRNSDPIPEKKVEKVEDKKVEEKKIEDKKPLKEKIKPKKAPKAKKGQRKNVSSAIEKQQFGEMKAPQNQEIIAAIFDSAYSSESTESSESSSETWKKIPKEFFCPITQAPMLDPVLTVAGQMYERAAIELWLQSKDTDPVARTNIKGMPLIPVYQVKSFVARKLGKA